MAKVNSFKQIAQIHPENSHFEPKNEGLEDDFLFQAGDFQVPAVNFPGLDCSRAI